MDFRKILDVINEAEKHKNKDMEVYSLEQFLAKNHVEPEKSSINEQDFDPNDINMLLKPNALKVLFEGMKQMWDMNGFTPKNDKQFLNFAERYLMLYFIRDSVPPGSVNTAQELTNILNQHSQDRELRDKVDKLSIKLIPLWHDYHWEDNPLQEEKLSGVTQKDFNKDELIKYLDRVVGEPVIDKKTGQPKVDKKGKPKVKSLKTKTDKYRYPYIHRSNIPIVNHNGVKYDLDKLAAMFTERPDSILKQNEKMKHSDGTLSQYYNVGLPALTGLVVDEENNKFVVVNTCPGAGACKVDCFAMKGGYIQWKGSSLAQTKLLNFVYNDPDGFMNKLADEISEYEKKNSKKKTKTIIRWHDAGDFFSTEYLQKAYDLARKFPNVDFYAYTKIADVAKGEKPDNFIINFSVGAQPSQEKQIDITVDKHSRVVPKVFFKDLTHREDVPTGKVNKRTKKPIMKSVLMYDSQEAIDTLKERLAKAYDVDKSSILTYDEMLAIPASDEVNKYNVIVKPGDGDTSANRRDVLGTYLLIH